MRRRLRRRAQPSQMASDWGLAKGRVASNHSNSCLCANAFVDCFTCFTCDTEERQWLNPTHELVVCRSVSSAADTHNQNTSERTEHEEQTMRRGVEGVAMGVCFASASALPLFWMVPSQKEWITRDSRALWSSLRLVPTTLAQWDSKEARLRNPQCVTRAHKTPQNWPMHIMKDQRNLRIPLAFAEGDR